MLKALSRNATTPFILIIKLPKIGLPLETKPLPPVLQGKKIGDQRMYSVVYFFLVFFPFFGGGGGYYGFIRHLGFTDNTPVGAEQTFKLNNAGKQHNV